MARLKTSQPIILVQELFFFLLVFFFFFLAFGFLLDLEPELFEEELVDDEELDGFAAFFFFFSFTLFFFFVFVLPEDAASVGDAGLALLLFLRLFFREEDDVLSDAFDVFFVVDFFGFFFALELLDALVLWPGFLRQNAFTLVPSDREKPLT